MSADLSEYVNGVQHIGIPTNNIDATVSFYNSLGFLTIFSSVNNGVPVAFLKFKNLMIEAYQNNLAAMKRGAIDHIALDVSDVQAVFEIIKTKGYSMIHKEIQFLPFLENGVGYFSIEGPNKEVIEFNQLL